MGTLFGNAPKVAGINIVTGGGSKVTDPFGIFQTPKAADPLPIPGPTPLPSPQSLTSSSGTALVARTLVNAGQQQPSTVFSDSTGTSGGYG